MGLLDDAIREHLDLKRRRGGDPAEIARLEQEALGPVRREPGPAAGGEAAAPAVDEPHEHAEPHEDVGAREHEAHRDEPGGAAEAAQERDHPEAAAPQHHEDPVLQPTTEYHVEEHHQHEEHAGDEAREEHGGPAADEAHEERSEGDTHDEPHEHGQTHPHDDDVLEETPDFLQETPEHDRLWFEQRPPRDFDFDG
jgi:hypothetical protein